MGSGHAIYLKSLKKDRSLELMSIFHECAQGRHKIAVKVLDIFGNDTMTIIEVSVGGDR